MLKKFQWIHLQFLALTVVIRGFSLSSLITTTEHKNQLPTQATYLTTQSKICFAKQSIVFDGGEWSSIKGDANERCPYGVTTAVTGTHDSKKVVGLIASDGISLDSGEIVTESSMAEVPDDVSDEQALWTALLCIARVHTVWPVLSNDENAVYPKPDIWILGGNDEAVTAANILEKLGATVTLVAKKQPSSFQGTFYWADGDVPFADALKSVDGILDVLGDENKSKVLLQNLKGEPWNCSRYVSLKSHSLKLVESNGVFGGPGKVTQYTKGLKMDEPNFAPAIGSTLERMFSSKSLFAKPKDCKDTSKPYIRTWELADFWESTTWPRQSMSNVRFGWPSDDNESEFYDYDDEEDDDEDEMVAAPPSRGTSDGLVEESIAADKRMTSPDVTWVTDSLAVEAIIAQPQKTAVLFVSAPFCRTCRYLKPLYYRMANQYKEHSVEFCQADASGPVGKVLSRKLDIEAVPSFLLFKHGERFGPAISVTKIPSPKLDLAVSWILDDDAEWDENAIQMVEAKEKRGK